MTKTRLEAFSDAVIAVAITLLALDLPNPPAAADRTLGAELAAQWPHFAAYLVSFLTIGIIWINHHEMLRPLIAIDRSVLVLNLVLLLTIAELPWATSVLATHLGEPVDGRWAALVYAGSFLAVSAVFAILQARLRSTPGLLASGRHPAAPTDTLGRNAIGMAAYAVSAGFASVSPFLTIGLCAGTAVFYAVPPRRSADPLPVVVGAPVPLARLPRFPTAQHPERGGVDAAQQPR